MRAKRILIVEDNRLLAAGLAELLEENGFEVPGMLVKGEEVLPWLTEHEVDAVIMDVRLKGQLTGIETVEAIKKTSQVPVIFLTAHEDAHTLSKVLNLRPSAFISKPYKEIDLLTAVRLATAPDTQVEVAESEDDDAGSGIPGVLVGKDFVYLRTKKQYERVPFADILYLRSDRSYTEVFLTKSTLVVSVPMGTLLEALPDNRFVRTHRSYAVNLSHITAFDREELQVGSHTVPLSAPHRKALLQLLKA